MRVVGVRRPMAAGRGSPMISRREALGDVAMLGLLALVDARVTWAAGPAPQRNVATCGRPARCLSEQDDSGRDSNHSRYINHR
jgi:hypothetical protein